MKLRQSVWLCAALVSAGAAWGFKANFHADINKASLATISRTVDGKTLKFTPKAINEVAQVNVDVDCGGESSCICVDCQSDPSRHFDNESFTLSSLRILRLKEAIIENLSSPSPGGFAARANLGKALHTIEDFYAHSTWVQIKGIGINPKLGRELLNSTDNDVASPSAQVCSNATHAALTTDVGTSEITTGFFLPAADDRSGTKGICYVGPELGPAAGKCRHGDFGRTDLTELIFGLGICPDGISQDRPGRPFYAQATSAAAAADIDFVNQILNYNGEPLHSGATYPPILNNARAIKTLLGIRITTLGMVIDTTGSMGSIQDRVKAAVGEIVNGLLGTEDEPGQYLLEPFNDPGVGPPIKTSDASVFLAAVNALSADGGDDCPEKAFSGLLEAINASDPQAVFFLFTDASANDGYLADKVILAAKQKGIVIKFALFGSCSPIDPNYQKVAAATGGQVFMLDASETSKTFALVKADVRSNPVTIASSAGTLGAPREYVVPVDSTQRAITFSTSVLGTHTSTKILRPSGVQVVAGDPGATVTDLSTGKIVTITSPQTGAWKVQIAGSGDFSVAVVGDSLLKFEDFQFVTLAGRVGHGGLFPIFGQPLAGRVQTGMALLSGPFNTAAFRVVSPAGDLLQTINLERGSPDASVDAFTGPITTPAGPFRVVVTGVDNSGVAYQRVFSQLFQGQAVSVSSSVTTSTLAAGTTTMIPFVVRNAGSAATYQIAAADGQRFVSGVSPSTLVLEANASGIVQVSVVVPANAMQNSSDAVTVTATNAADPTVTNGATASFTVDAVLARTSISFSNQILGSTSSPQSVSIRNTGSTPLAIQQVTVSPDFTQTNDCGPRLAVGANCTVRVSSSPATLGARSGTVTVVDDSAASPRLIVLSATGTNFAVAAAAPGSATIRAGQSATFPLNLSTQGGALGDEVTFGCSGLPQGVTCSFSPATLAAGTEAATTTLTIATKASAGIVLAPIDSLREWLPVAAMAALALMAIARLPKRRFLTALSRLSVLFSAAYLISCGGGGSGGGGTSGTPAGTYNIDVTASSGGASRSTPVSVTVN